MTVLEIAWWWNQRSGRRNMPQRSRSRAFKTLRRRIEHGSSGDPRWLKRPSQAGSSYLVLNDRIYGNPEIPKGFGAAHNI